MNLDILVPCIRHDNLEFLLNSIVDQKIPDTRVTIYNDARSKEVAAYIKQIQEEKIFEGKITLNYQERPYGEKHGASMARNAAYASIKEDCAPYIMFIDDDCQLMSGVLQNMIDIIDDVDFVYGNYEFDNGQQFISRKFNPYVLRTHNYICTMSLMKKEVFEIVGGFNVNMDYFQDWTFFYQAAKKHLKGKYLNEIIFKTKTPDKDSISGIDISLNEKAKIFRKENNIEDTDLVVSTFGCQLQAEQRAEMLNADYAGIMNAGGGIFPVNLQYDNWTHTYMIGAFNSPVNALINHINAMHGKKILHFVGTDTFQLMEKHAWSQLQLIKKKFIDDDITILSNSQNLHNELNELGINNQLVYTPLYKPERFQQTVLPEDFTIGVYYSDTRNMNFMNVQGDIMDNNNGESNMYLIWDIAKALPHIKFKFFGGKAKFKTENVEFVGRIPSEEMPGFINSCSMILLSTVHNSMPHLPIQFLLSGRNALVSCIGDDIKYMDKLSFTDILHYENCKDEIISKIKAIKDRGPISSQENMLHRNYYLDLMNVEKYRQEIKSIMEKNNG